MILRLYATTWPAGKSSVPRLAHVVLVLAACAQMGLIHHVQCANYTVGAGFTDTPTGNGLNFSWTNTVDGLVKADILEARYQQWANSVNVTAGDILIFDYVRGQHTVFLPKTELAYANCDFSQGSLETLQDTIPVFYIIKPTDVELFFTCTVPGHCASGQKVKIVPHGTAAASILPPSSNSPQHPKLSAGTLLMILFVCYLALFAQYYENHLYL